MDQPELRLIARPAQSTRAIIFIHGGWSQNWGSEKEDLKDLTNSLRGAGWTEAIYHLWWDSSENPWLNWPRIGSVMDRAKRVGSHHFSNLVSLKADEKEVSILAFSFGVRVAYYALEAWTGQHYLNDAILLGGAIKRNSSKKWGYVASKLNKHLFNVYNKDDPRLDEFRRYYQDGTSPCGRKPIQERHSKIVNICATDLVGKSHSLRRYLEHLPSFITWS